MKHKPLEGQKAFPFMAEPRRSRRPKLVVVRAEPEAKPPEAEDKSVAKTRRRLPKAG